MFDFSIILHLTISVLVMWLFLDDFILVDLGPFMHGLIYKETFLFATYWSISFDLFWFELLILIEKTLPLWTSLKWIIDTLFTWCHLLTGCYISWITCLLLCFCTPLFVNLYIWMFLLLNIHLSDYSFFYFFYFLYIQNILYTKDECYILRFCFISARVLLVIFTN